MHDFGSIQDAATGTWCNIELVPGERFNDYNFCAFVSLWLNFYHICNFYIYIVINQF
jgi:hypothetical protein